MNSANRPKDKRQIITLAEASEMYGIPRKYLLRWKRDGALNELSGLVIQNGRPMVNRDVIEKLFQLVPLARAKAHHHHNGTELMR